MSKSILAALLAAALAAFFTPGAAAQSGPPALTWQYYNVTLAVPRSGYDAKALASAFCRTRNHKGASEYTAAMINPGTAFFSHINCVGHLFM